jgi:uncharacterized repeat protein (TIGR03803 family)
MKPESISAITGRVASSAHSTKQIRQQWCACALALAAVLTLATFAAPSVHAQTFVVLYSFTGKGDGGGAAGGVVRDPKGNLYGTTGGGGTDNLGTVFEVNTARKETVLYSFAQLTDGVSPFARLARDAAGNLYGTTLYGGDLKCHSGLCGTVFKVTTNREEIVLHPFKDGTDGAAPILLSGGHMESRTIAISYEHSVTLKQYSEVVSGRKGLERKYSVRESLWERTPGSEWHMQRLGCLFRHLAPT